MRRSSLIPLLAVSLVLTACSSTSGATPTITQFVTVTGSSPAPSGATTSGGPITVVSSPGATAPPTSAGASASTGASGTEVSASGSPSAKPSATSGAPTSSAGPIVKVDPLKSDCKTLLDERDIKKVLGASIAAASLRVVDVANPERKMTGRIKCYYGVKTGSKDHPVGVALAQYASTADATAQLGLTVESEVGLGAAQSQSSVQGHPATVLLRDGGLIVMQYDTWTLSVAVEATVAPAAKMPAGLTALATLVLARVLKNG